MKPLLTACFALCLLATKLSAATLRVPAQHARIQSAVDAAKAGDIVLVAAGTYRERVTLKACVTLRSAGDDAPGKLGLARAEGVSVLARGGAECRERRLRGEARRVPLQRQQRLVDEPVLGT